MSDVNGNLAIRTINGDPNLWLPVVAPITCSVIVIQNTDGSNSMKVRTDAGDPNTEKTQPASMELTLRSVIPSAWGPNMTVCFVKPSAAETPIVVTFIR